jgi:Tol biopolymer transport system component
MSHQPAISADGAVVAFTTGASNLAGRDTNGEADVFVVATATGALVRMSGNAAGEAVGGSYPGLSRDGRVVAFLTTSADLVPRAASPGIVAALVTLPAR